MVAKTKLAKKLQNGFHHERQQLAAAAAKLSKKALRTEKIVEDYAKENPWKTMGMSVLAGIIVAQVLNLRK